MLQHKCFLTEGWIWIICCILLWISLMSTWLPNTRAAASNNYAAFLISTSAVLLIKVWAKKGRLAMLCFTAAPPSSAPPLTSLMSLCQAQLECLQIHHMPYTPLYPQLGKVCQQYSQRFLCAWYSFTVTLTLKINLKQSPR